MNPIKSALTKTKTRKSSIPFLKNTKTRQHSIPHLKNVHFELPNISSGKNHPKINKSPSLHTRKFKNKYKNILDFYPKSPIQFFKQSSISQSKSSSKKTKILILKPSAKHSSQTADEDYTKQILLNNNVGIPELKEIQRHIQAKIFDMNEKIEIQDRKREHFTPRISISKPIIIHSKSLILKKPKYIAGVEMSLNEILKIFTKEDFPIRKKTIKDEKKKKPIINRRSMANITKYVFSLNEKTEKYSNINKDFRQLSKKNILYDSLGEDEFEEEVKNSFMEISIPPDNIYIFIFDMLIFVSTIFLLVFMPYYLSNTICFCDFEKYGLLEINIIIDILFILDVIISFFRSYYDFELNLIKQNKKIAKNYITSQFIWDLLEALPIYFYSVLKCNSDEKLKYVCYEYSMSTNLIIIKLLLSLKLLKIMKIIGDVKNQNSKLLDKIISTDNFKLEKFIDLSVFTFYCFLFIHYLVCLYLFIGKQSYPNWLSYTKIQNDNYTIKYLTSLYSIITTMSTVGYGDITCQSSIERIFQIVLLAIGIIAYSYIVTKMGNYFKNETHALTKLNQDTSILEEIRISYPKMSFELYKKINHHLLSRFNKRKKIGLNILVNSLPYSMKKQILFTVFQEQIRNFTYFRNCDNSNFIFKILSHFILFTCKKDDYILYEGERVSNIIFVKEGCLTLELSINIDDPRTSLENYLIKNFIGIEHKKKNPINTGDTIFPQAAISGISRKRTSNFSSLKSKIGDVINTEKNCLSHKNDHGTFTEEEELKVYREAGKINFSDDVNFGKHGTNYQHIKVLDIRKNEYFGDVNLYKDKNAPLSLKVKSKLAELFLINKHTAVEIKKEYPNICKSIYKISFHNLLTIKKLTFRTLKRYIETYGIFGCPYKKQKEAIDNLEEKVKEASMFSSGHSTIIKNNNIISPFLNQNQNLKFSNISNFKLNQNRKIPKMFNSNIKETRSSTNIKKINVNSSTLLLGGNTSKNSLKIKKITTFEKNSKKNIKILDEYDGDDECDEKNSDLDENIINKSIARKNTKDLPKIFSEEETSKNSMNEESVIFTLNNMSNSMKNKIKKHVQHSQRKLRNKKIFCLLKKFLVENKEQILKICFSEEKLQQIIQKKSTDSKLSISDNTNVLNILSQIENYDYSSSDSSFSDEQNKNEHIFKITKMDSFEIKSIYPNINKIIKKNKTNKNNHFFEKYERVLKKLEKITYKGNKEKENFSDFIGSMKTFSKKTMSYPIKRLSKSPKKVNIENFITSREQKSKYTLKKNSSKNINSKIEYLDSSLFDVNFESNLIYTPKNTQSKKEIEKLNYSELKDIKNGSFFNENNLNAYNNLLKNFKESSKSNKYKKYCMTPSNKNKKRKNGITKDSYFIDKSKSIQLKSKFQSNTNIIRNCISREYKNRLSIKNKKNTNEKSLDHSDLNNDNSKIVISTKNPMSSYNYDYIDKNVNENENSGKNCIIY